MPEPRQRVRRRPARRSNRALPSYRRRSSAEWARQARRQRSPAPAPTPPERPSPRPRARCGARRD
eukprot:14939647-Alexandrium_andersonii.AAC.1